MYVYLTYYGANDNIILLCNFYTYDVYVIIYRHPVSVRKKLVLIFPCLCSRSFGTVCSKCSKGISASHWVRKARDHVYHLACFRCDACDRQLNTGEEFALHEGRVLCKPHYLDIVDGGTTSSSGTPLFYCYYCYCRIILCLSVIFPPCCLYRSSHNNMGNVQSY